MKAVRFAGRDGVAHVGALEGEVVRDAGPAGAAGFIPSAEGWARLATASGPEHPLAGLTLLHPVHPGKILAIGLNYRAHAEESELAIPEVPVVFAKFPSSLIGSGAAIVIPREETRPDWEGEVAVVIGRRTYRADRAGAREAIGGISALNDVSGRRAQLETPLRQFTLGKSFDTFTPMGPAIASAEDLDLEDIEVSTTVSGELMQQATTRELIFSILELIVYLSAGVTLEPGDVIATGTPSGVGDSRTPPRHLREGDVVEVSVSGVGTLRNPVTMER
jgi:2-keto-4-pentenoate hydratase/2-oxohepta-3-ene-1,7-dioic acid hydratase in catechol pathway